MFRCSPPHRLADHWIAVVKLAVGRRCRMRRVDALVGAMFRIDAMWLTVEPVDMRAGTERLLMSVV